jgi:hypothetical protein
MFFELALNRGLGVEIGDLAWIVLGAVVVNSLDSLGIQQSWAWACAA